jgi:hypothetical protein
MENSMEIPEKIKPGNTIHGHISKVNSSQDKIQSLAHPCLLQHYLQQSISSISTDCIQVMNRIK